MNNPVVSVAMITYGHESYLEQAISSVLMQKCDVDFELIIADDCSPDRTTQIVQSIIDTHPKGKAVRYIRHKNNKGVANNFAWVLEQCRGDYIAICEGDDFWVEPDKLQKQFNFLKDNPDFALCSHSSNEVDENNCVFDVSTRADDVIDLSVVLKEGWFIRTATMFFRREVIDAGIPSFFYTAYSTDYILQVMALKHGKCKYFPEAMSAYRTHAAGFSNISTELLVRRQQMIIPLLDVLNNYTDNKYTEEIRIHQTRIKQDVSANLVRYPFLITSLGLIFYIKNFHLILFLKSLLRRFNSK